MQFTNVCSWGKHMLEVWEARLGMRRNSTGMPLATEVSGNHMRNSEGEMVLQSCPS